MSGGVTKLTDAAAHQAREAVRQAADSQDDVIESFEQPGMTRVIWLTVEEFADTYSEALRVFYERVGAIALIAASLWLVAYGFGLVNTPNPLTLHPMILAILVCTAMPAAMWLWTDAAKVANFRKLYGVSRQFVDAMFALRSETFAVGRDYLYVSRLHNGEVQVHSVSRSEISAIDLTPQHCFHNDFADVALLDLAGHPMLAAKGFDIDAARRLQSHFTV